MSRSMKAAALLQLVCAACGQQAPPEADDSYFPLVDGASWEYLHSNGGWSESVTLEAAADEPDVFVQRQTGDPDGESSSSTFVLEDGDVLRVAEEQFLMDELLYSVTYDPGFLRFSDAWVHAAAGATETREYERTETEVGMDPKDPQPRAHVYTVEDVSESVTVPAGTFRNCLRIRRVRDLTHPDLMGATDQGEQDKLYWFAPGVGKVREENSISGTTEVLVDYDIPEE
jgi:hypothetical protein